SGVQVMDMHRVFGYVVAQFVRAADDRAALAAAPGLPHAERMGMMVASQELRAVPLLVHGRAAKLAAPDDPIPVEPDGAAGVLLVAVRIGIAGQIQPDARPAF